jgi:DNA/RNA endonuclease YhcR with UshA esterase domain
MSRILGASFKEQHMRIGAFAFAFAVAVAVPAFADDAVPVKIQASEAAAHIGETVTVVGVLTNVHKTPGKSILWDIGAKYPDNPMTVYVGKRDTDTIPDVTPLIGKTLAITGLLKTYQGKPEIAVTDVKQVAVAP